MSTPSRADEHGLDRPAGDAPRADAPPATRADLRERHGEADGAGDAETLEALLGQEDDRPRSRAEERAAREAKPAAREEPKTWKPRRQVASLALTFSMFGLSMSWFMPWAAPASLVAVILGTIAVCRRWDDRAAGGWALGLGLAGLAASGFWVYWIWHELMLAAA